jgi:diguanylate cyclase (GGDEF)-like protein
VQDFPPIQPMSPREPIGYRLLIQGLILAVAYFVSAKIGLSFATVASSVTMLWPPSGLTLFALLMFGARLWPAVFLGALAVNATTGVPFGAAVGIAAGNCLEAVTGFYLLQAAGFETRLARVRDVVALVVLAAGVSTMIGATVGASMLASFNVIPWSGIGHSWLTWWMGDAMGVLVFGPLLLVWWQSADETWSVARVVEAVLLLALTMLGSELFLGGRLLAATSSPLPLAFMLFPLQVWAALRFGMRGAASITLVIGIAALAGIIAGEGLFVHGSTLESLLLLWLYTNVLAITGLALAATVSERRLAESRLRHLAQHDPLTGLPNRVTLQEHIAVAMHHADRRRRQLAILFVDIDRFKVINDTLGHSVGDLLLNMAGARLRDCVRMEDIVTRHGGDEFVILVDSITRSEDVGRIAEKVLAAFRKPFLVQQLPLHVSASIGICFYPVDGRDVDTLLKNADTAMYRAKDLGRNAYVFYSSEMNARMAERFAMENDLRHALDRGEFELHYQSQYNVETGQVVAAEALLRWRRAGGEFVPPDAFIPLLEETGLINRVGAWVLDTACEQLAQWRAQGMHSLRMSVNVSSHQLSDPVLPSLVTVALTRHGLPASLLELEITESMLVRQGPVVENIIRQIVEFGVRLAVDDFGTGYSSLSYLHRLSIDTLKIDRAFVQLLPAHENSAAIARAIVGLGKSLHLTLVAEGVETIEQRDFLREIGCDLMQGFLFSRPVPAENFVLRTPVMPVLARKIND